MGSARRKLLPTTPTAEHAPRAVYVYCVVRATATPNLKQPDPRLPDAGDMQVLPLGARAWMVVADVPLAVYGAEAIESRIKDLDWVGTCGVAHQAMLDACMRATDAVVPMKVLTIFNSIERARGEMKRHARQLNALMQQVAGCVEWGVRVTRAPQPVQDLERRVKQEQKAAAAATAAAAGARGEAQATKQDTGSGNGTGTAFLAAKVRQRVAMQEAAAALDQHVRELADTLTEVTRDVRYRRDPTQHTPVPVLLDAAYLVPRRVESRFRLQVRLLSRPLLARGCRVTVTGPWPAYSFVSPAGR